MGNSTSSVGHAVRVVARLVALLLCACTKPAYLQGPTGGADASRPDLPPAADDEGDAQEPEGDASTAAIDGGAEAPNASCITPAVGLSPLRRLTHFEYDNSVRDLLGDTSGPASRFARDTPAGLFDTAVDGQQVSLALAEQYLDTAIALAGTADLDQVVGCDPVDATCARDFITRFGRRAFRRLLQQAELDDIMMTFEAGRVAQDAETGLRAAIAAILASPKFVFRPEQGGTSSAPPVAKRLTSFELAARLASLLWASVPDDTLLDLAASGQLETTAQLEAQARRMLADARARRAQTSFYEQWLGLARLSTVTKDPAVYPQFDAVLRDAMLQETRAFIDHVLWSDDGRLETLLTASCSFVNATLAGLYGLPAPNGQRLTKAQLDPAQRAGVLTHASVLSAFGGVRQSAPSVRGAWLRQRVLCEAQSNPHGPLTELPALTARVSNREQIAMLTAEPACRSCHAPIDGIGFGLEHYDGMGAYRPLDRGIPVDAHGQIVGTQDSDGAFEGAPELARILGKSAQVRDCVAAQWLRFALGRAEQADDTCSLTALRKAFASADGDLQELLVALTQTPAFQSYRQAH